MRLFGVAAAACGFAAVAAGLFGAASAAPRPRSGPDVKPIAVPPEDRQTLLDGNQAFAFDSFRELGKKPGNLVYSPISVSAVLAMTTAGARGATRDQLADALRIDLAGESLDVAFQSVLASLRPRKVGVTFEIADGFWMVDGFDFQPGYVSLLRRRYGAQAKSIDFPRLVPDINKWCVRRTHGMIPKAVESLEPSTVAVLANVVYLDAKWARPFLPSDTQNDAFTRADGTQTAVRTMHQKATVPLFAEWDPAEPDVATAGSAVHVAELAYKDPDFSMLVVVPRAADALPEVEARLSPQTLATWTSSMTETAATIALPRFETTSAIDLVPAVQALGATDVFDPTGRADLSGVGGAPGQLYLGVLFQKARIQVMEKGTRAAAVTIGGVQITAVLPEPFPFRADRPFLYLVRHKPTGTILFMGRVADAAEAQAR